MRPALLALLAALLGCGAPGPADPAPPDPGPPGSSSGTGSGDGGSGGTGGVTEPPAVRATFDRLDDGGDCAGLVPGEPAAAPVVIEWSPPAGATCAGGFTDGTGHAALSADLGDGTAAWRLHSPSGGPLGSARASALTPQPEGFHAIRVSTGPSADTPLVEHVALGPSGDERRATIVSSDPADYTRFAWSYSADPAGGGAVLFQSVTLRGNHWFGLKASRFDAAGEPGPEGAAVASDSDGGTGPIFRACGVSRSGDQLALWQQSAWVYLAWLDRAGTVIAGAPPGEGDRADVVLGDLDYRARALELAPLLDGALALRVDGAFRRTYEPRAVRSSPLPAWLAERTDASFRFTRGNAGYAVFRPGAGTSAGDCSRRIELVSPSGRLCGRAVLPAPGGACEPGAIDQGWDGGVVEQLAPGACRWRVWPRLLAR